jgi:hypothetical protein
VYIWASYKSQKRSQYDPGITSAYNRNEYQEYILWSKGGRCVGLKTFLPSCPNCLEILGVTTPWNPQGLYWIPTELPRPRTYQSNLHFYQKLFLKTAICGNSGMFQVPLFVRCCWGCLLSVSDVPNSYTASPAPRQLLAGLLVLLSPIILSLWYY